MAILNGLKVTIEDLQTKEKCQEYQAQSCQIVPSSWVKTFVAVENGRYIQFCIRTLADFAWNGANGLKVVISVDENENISRYPVLLTKNPKYINSKYHAQHDLSRTEDFRQVLLLQKEPGGLHKGRISGLVGKKVCNNLFYDWRLQVKHIAEGKSKEPSSLFCGTIRLKIERFGFRQVKDESRTNINQDRRYKFESNFKRSHKSLLMEEGINLEIRASAQQVREPEEFVPFRRQLGHHPLVGEFWFSYRDHATFSQILAQENVRAEPIVKLERPLEQISRERTSALSTTRQSVLIQHGDQQESQNVEAETDLAPRSQPKNLNNVTDPDISEDEAVQALVQELEGWKAQNDDLSAEVNTLEYAYKEAKIRTRKINLAAQIETFKADAATKKARVKHLKRMIDSDKSKLEGSVMNEVRLNEMREPAPKRMRR